MCLCGAGDGVEGAAKEDMLDLEVHDSAGTVGPSVVKRFPFLNGCTALRLPESIFTDPKKARPCIDEVFAYMLLSLHMSEFWTAEQVLCNFNLHLLRVHQCLNVSIQALNSWVLCCLKVPKCCD